MKYLGFAVTIAILALLWCAVEFPPAAQPGPVPPPAVQTTTGGQNAGPVAASQTPANATHAAGTSVGGLFTLPVARNAGGSGVVTQVGVRSAGGYLGGYSLRVWQKNPTGTTCTDNAAFVANATDNLNLVSSPVSLFPQSVSGETATYRSADFEWSYRNADLTPGTNLYACLVALNADATDANASVTVILSATQN